MGAAKLRRQRPVGLLVAHRDKGGVIAAADEVHRVQRKGTIANRADPIGRMFRSKSPHCERVEAGPALGRWRARRAMGVNHRPTRPVRFAAPQRPLAVVGGGRDASIRTPLRAEL